MNTKQHKQVINVQIAEKNQLFINQLKLIAKEYDHAFPNTVEFKIKITTDPAKFKFSDIEKAELTFIEDIFLLEIQDTLISKQVLKKDIILLMNDNFSAEVLVKIKRIIDKNSLNLNGHISLTNYTFHLNKLLVTDFIKAKLIVYDYKEI